MVHTYIPSGLRGSKETEIVKKNGRERSRTRKQLVGIRDMIIEKTWEQERALIALGSHMIYTMYVSLSLQQNFLQRRHHLLLCWTPLYWVFLDHFLLFDRPSYGFWMWGKKIQKQGDEKVSYTCIGGCTKRGRSLQEVCSSLFYLLFSLSFVLKLFFFFT